MSRPEEVKSEFIQLYRADASKVVDMVKDILEKSSDQTRGGGPAGPGAIRAYARFRTRQCRSPRKLIMTSRR